MEKKINNISETRFLLVIRQHSDTEKRKCNSTQYLGGTESFFFIKEAGM